jgi:hypothetical protein
MLLEKIRIDGDTQARARLNETVVAEYAAHMKDGDQFPPLIVFFDGSDYWLADGFHRYFAYKQHAQLDVDVEVKEGTKDDALLFAFGANAKRGLSMSHEDFKAIIRRMLQHPEWSQWTNTTIAKHIGCSSMTVGRIKRELEKESTPAETTKKYKDKDGNEREVDTTKLATKKKQPEPEPEVDDGAIGELADVIEQLKDENTKLKDAVALGQFDATEIEKIDVQDTLEQLREENRVLRIENEALKKSRDQYQKENAELIRTVKSLQKKLKGQ